MDREIEHSDAPPFLELRNIHNAKVEMEERLAELESSASRLAQILEAEGRAYRPIDAEALSMPAPPKALPVIIKDRVWEWIENCVGMIINLKRVGAPKRQAVRVKPPGPVLVANAAHDSYESLYGYMCEQDSFHKRRKMLHREAGCATLEVVWP